MEFNSSAKICTTYTDYDFSKIVLTDPESLQGGSFFTKLNIDNSMVYIQTPKCVSKQGMVVTSGKKSYIELMFSNEHSEFIGFIENLEKACIEKIYTRKNSWFTNDIDQADIENAFTSALRSFKSGKYYLLRANIASSKNMLKMPTCSVFDENEKQLVLEDIKPEQDLITVLEIQGIKFTSRSFQFEILIRQVLVLSDKPVFQACVIKRNQPHTQQSHIHNTEDNVSVPVSVPALAPLHIVEHRDESVTINGMSTIMEKNNTTPQIQTAVPASVAAVAAVAPVPASQAILSLASKSLVIDSGESMDVDTSIPPSTKTQTNIDSRPQPMETKCDTLEKEKVKDFIEIMELTDADLEIKNDENIKIKPANDIYYELYRVAKDKARSARKLAFDAYLEVKKIKKTYMLDDSDSDFSNSSKSDNSDDSNDSYDSDNTNDTSNDTSTHA
jgi:hypothetical protein